MARTTAWLPDQRARSSARIPAAMEISSCLPSMDASCCATSRNCCGLTAQTMTSLPATPPARLSVVRTPNCACNRARLSVLISTTPICPAANPLPSMPPISAVAMLPPPIKQMFIYFSPQTVKPEPNVGRAMPDMVGIAHPTDYLNNSPLPENRRTDAHYGRTFRDGCGKVVRHAHRQGVQLQPLTVQLPT